MKDHGVSLNKHCPCTQAQCPIRGNCVLCIQNHLEHKRHVPECIQDILRPAVKLLADQMELAAEDARRSECFWRNFDVEEFVDKSIGRHDDS